MTQPSTLRYAAVENFRASDLTGSCAVGPRSLSVFLLELLPELSAFGASTKRFGDVGLIAFEMLD
jgi:hypothetical protein